MSDLPEQELFQQLNANPVSGEHLEMLGKKAAAAWECGDCCTLTEAVVETVKQAGLSPEQVKRVVEFANTSAYLNAFNKEASDHKYIDFGAGGPANPAAVLQDLNDGGGGSVFDPGTGDYHQPPPDAVKTSAVSEEAFAQMFRAEGPTEYPEANPLGDVIDLRDKLASGYDSLTSQISGLQGMLGDLTDRIFFQVKQAALSGHSLGEVVDAWEPVAPDQEYVKVAFSMVMDRLLENGVFRAPEDMAESFQKAASARNVVNQDHPLITEFQDFCTTIDKLAELREEREHVSEGLGQLTQFLKMAGKEGLLLRGADALSRAAGIAGTKGQALGEALLNEQAGKWMGRGAKALTYAAPAIAANEVYRRTLKHNPGFQAARGALAGAIPGTAAYRNKELELAMAGGGGQYY